MQKNLKIALAAGFIAVGFYFIFWGFGKLFTDYSLEGLRVAVERNSEVDRVSSLEQKLYQNYVQDLQLFEMTQEKPDFEKLAILGVTAKELGGAGGKVRGVQDLNFYLQKVSAARRPGPLSKNIGFSFDQLMEQSFGAILSFVRLQWEKITGVDEREAALPGMDETLYEQAQAMEVSGDLEGAAQIYLRYAQLNPQVKDMGFAMLNVARLKIKQQKIDEAVVILNEISKKYFGRPESRFASVMAKQTEEIQKHRGKIHELIGALPQGDIRQASEETRLELVKSFLITGQIADAREISKGLVSSKNVPIADAAKFYLAWAYKIEKDFRKSAEVFETLLTQPHIESDYRNEIHSELAEVYYKLNDKEKAIEQYQKIGKQARESVQGPQSVWSSMAELETAKIYYFDLQDAGAAFESLSSIEGGSGLAAQAARELKGVAQTQIRAKAFMALQAGKLSSAEELFKKGLELDPKDGRAMAGLASIRLLAGDLGDALQLAEQAFELKSDQYTSAMLGYTYQVSGNYPKAIEFYRRSVALDGQYLSSAYNLAYCYLVTKEYQRAFEILSQISLNIHGLSNYVKSKIFNNMGCALWGLGRYDEARGKFSESLNITPDFQLARANLTLSVPGNSPQAAKPESVG